MLRMGLRTRGKRGLVPDAETGKITTVWVVSIPYLFSFIINRLRYKLDGYLK